VTSAIPPGALHGVGPVAAAEGFGSITLRSVDGSTEAEFVPSANMVCCSLRHHGVEFLHQGSGVAAYAHRGMTMGIPLLYPWANRLGGFEYKVGGERVVLPRGGGVIPVDDSGLPIHGALPALMRWEMEESQPGAIMATLLWTSPELLALFPFPHELSLEVSLESGRLMIATTLRPTGDAGVPVSFGYHPYLRVPGAPREAWRVTLGAFRRLLLDVGMIPTGAREPVGRRCMYLEDVSFDDAFDALSVPAEFGAAAGEFAVTVEFLEGFPYAQVYAPAGRDFICFEPMTAPTNALNSGDSLRLVGPGERHRATFLVSVSGRGRNGQGDS
jgi:aldose 1-epimerase